jgi:hypothetical protein
MKMKEKVHHALLTSIDTKIIELTKVLNETIEATSSDSKSSAGDKHETGVAMAQLEQEKLSKQLNELLNQKNQIKSLNPQLVHIKITKGSLVKTNNGFYYFSIGLGVLEVNDNTIFALNPLAPLGQSMLGKKAGDSIIFNTKNFEIRTVE